MIKKLKELFTVNYVFNLILVIMMGLVHGMAFEILKLYIVLSQVL